MFEGQTAHAIARLMASEPWKTLHLFDSCVGLPACTVWDVPGAPAHPVDTQAHPKTAGLYAAPEAKIRQTMENSPTDWVLHPGWFSETCPDFAASLCFAHVDCDLYAGTVLALETCRRLVIPRGIVVVHDYGTHWCGVTRAVDEVCSVETWQSVGNVAIDGQRVMQRRGENGWRRA